MSETVIFKALPKEPDEENLGSMKAEKVVIAAVQAKSSVLEATFKLGSRLHKIWNLIVEAALKSGKLDYIWEHFIEKEIGVSDKKIAKKVKFCIEFTKLVISTKIRDISFIFSKNFMRILSANITKHKFSAHSLAAELKVMLMVYIDKEDIAAENCLLKIFELAREDLPEKILIELGSRLIWKVDESFLIENLASFLKKGKSSIVVSFLSEIMKKQIKSKEIVGGIFKYLMKLSVREDNLSNQTKNCLMNSLVKQTCSKVSLIFQYVSGYSLSSKVKSYFRKTQKLDIDTEDLLLFTKSQWKSLFKLFYILLVESLLHSNLEDSHEFFMIIKSLYKGKNLNELYMFFLSQLAKPAAYIRNAVNETFRMFTGEITEEFLEKLCHVISTGDIKIEAPEETPNPEPDEEIKDLDVLLEETTKKNPHEELKEHFLLRASELVQILVKNIENFDTWAALYLTVVETLKRVLSQKYSRSHDLTNKCLSILQKFNTRNISFKPENFETLSEIFKIVIGRAFRDEEVNKPLEENLVYLLKHMEVLNHDMMTEIVENLLNKHFKSHSSRLSLKLVKSILGTCFDEKIGKILLLYCKEGRSFPVKTQAFELLAHYCRRYEGCEKYTPKILRVFQNVCKSEEKLKERNELLKEILIVLNQIFHKEYSKKIKKIEKLVEKIPNLKGVWSNIAKKLSKDN